MNRLNARIVDWLSQLLDRDEREAVLGDFDELTISNHHALRQLLGLVLRRRVQAWADWRPWFALLGVVMPVGFVLSLVSRYWSISMSIYSWLYINNWTWAHVGSPGARADLAQTACMVCLWGAALAMWSWTTGFAVGSLSRQTIWVHDALFCLVVFGGTVGSSTTGAMNPANAVVFSLALYRLVLPAIVKAVLVVLPAALGMRSGVRRSTLSLRPTIALAAIVATLTASTARSVEGAVTFGWMSESVAAPVVSGLLRWRGSWQLSALPLLMVWPTIFIVVGATFRGWRDEPLES